MRFKIRHNLRRAASNKTIDLFDKMIMRLCVCIFNAKPKLISKTDYMIQFFFSRL